MKIRLIFLIILISVLPICAQINQFVDVASSMGINYPIQFLRGSVSFCDFDEDGYDDLSFSSAQNYPLFIYKNDVSIFDYITTNLQLNDSLRSMNILWADYDNDGDKDLFCGVDYESTYSRLYRNDNGIMVDVTIPAGIGTVPSTCNSAAFADYNNDGWLDLFVTHYSEYTANYLYKNNHDGTFTDVTNEAGLTGFDSTAGYYKLPFALTFFDYDNDGWLDLHICNDHFTKDFQYRNNGDGTFTDVSVSSGAGVGGFMMGIAVGDYDDNGFLDMYLSNDPFGNYLLKNNGDGTFTDVAEDLGVTMNKSCWGTNFIDYDNDGDLDIYSCSETSENGLFKNNGDGTFTQVTGIGLDGDFISYGCAIGDFDNNGYTDIAVHNDQSLSNVYKNNGGTNNWFKLNLQGVECNRDGIGSKIEVYINGKKLIRELTCGTSYMSQNSNTTIIGTGTNTIIDSIIVDWAGSHNIDVLRNITVNQTMTLVEGQTILDAGNSNSVVNEFNLFQNYPNPFNPSTKISYNLVVSSNVKLSIYNVLGELVSVLVNEFQPSGKQNITFDKKELNSGVYFYRIEAVGSNGRNYSQTKKMILAK